jgi:hypothetical protein
MTPAPYRGLPVYYFGSGSTGSMQRRENGVAVPRAPRGGFPPTGSMTLYSPISVRVGSG